MSLLRSARAIVITAMFATAVEAAEIVKVEASGGCYTPALAFAKKHNLMLVETKIVRPSGSIAPPCLVAPCEATLFFTTKSGSGTFAIFDNLSADEQRCLSYRIELTTPPTAPLRTLPKPW